MPASCEPAGPRRARWDSVSSRAQETRGIGMGDDPQLQARGVRALVAALGPADAVAFLHRLTPDLSGFISREASPERLLPSALAAAPYPPRVVRTFEAPAPRPVQHQELLPFTEPVVPMMRNLGLLLNRSRSRQKMTRNVENYYPGWSNPGSRRRSRRWHMFCRITQTQGTAILLLRSDTGCAGKPKGLRRKAFQI